MFKPNFLIIPRVIYEDKKLKPMDRLVFGIVYWYEHLKDGHCTAANETIAKVLGTKGPSIANSLSVLEKRGYIKRSFKDDGRRNRLAISTTVHFSRHSSNDDASIHQTMNRVSNKSKNKMQTPTEFALSESEIQRSTDMEYTKKDVGLRDVPDQRQEKPRKHKNPVVIRLVEKFRTLCVEKGVARSKPVVLGDGYKIVVSALTTHGLTEEQVEDLFDEWFGLGKPDDKTVHIRQALSAHQINSYKTRNGVE